jgi:hypothetical protein
MHRVGVSPAATCSEPTQCSQQQVALWRPRLLQLLLFNMMHRCYARHLLPCGGNNYAGSINDAYSPAWRAGEPSPEQAAELLEDVITSEPLMHGDRNETLFTVEWNGYCCFCCLSDVRNVNGGASSCARAATAAVFLLMVLC